MQVLSAAYAFGICKHAELAGLHEQRAISLAAAGLPLAAFSDYLTSVKVRTAICLPARLPACLPACLPVRPSVRNAGFSWIVSSSYNNFMHCIALSCCTVWWIGIL